MSVYTHIAIGAALGAVAPNAPAAFFFGLASHIPADAVSHFDFRRLSWDIILAAASFVAFGALAGWNGAVVWGSIGAAAPDVENLLARAGIRARRGLFFPGHDGRLRHGTPLPWPFGCIQLFVTAILAAWVFGARSVV